MIQTVLSVVIVFAKPWAIRDADEPEELEYDSRRVDCERSNDRAGLAMTNFWSIGDSNFTALSASI